MSQAFFVASSVVAFAEIGDKTQLLSLALVSKYRKPVPIVLGVLVASLANHACAGGLGGLLAHILRQDILNWAVVASFALMAGWILIPDRLGSSEAGGCKDTMGVFTCTVIGFFLAEMGDKTQVVTIALAAHFHSFFSVVGGATCGMMLANIPVIYLGNRFASRFPARAVHAVAAAILIVLGGLAIKNALNGATSF